MKPLKLKVIGVMAVAMVCMMLSSAVQASLVSSYSDSVTGSSPSTYAIYNTDLLSLTQFNPTLGTLTKVSLTLSNDFYAQAKGENTNNNNTKTFSYSLSNMTLDIRYAGEATKLLNDGPHSSSHASETLAKFDQILDYGGASGRTYTIDPSLFPVPLVYTSGTDFNRFIGTGAVNFDIFTGVSFSTSGNAAERHAIQSFLANASVLYEYTPVPVPAAAWLLGTGLIGLVAIRRRKAN